MHDTAAAFGAAFLRSYVDAIEHPRILEIGAGDVNGSLRGCAPSTADYIGVDVEGGPGVDLVLADPYSYPFDAESFDAIVSSSCLEHDPMFWLAFVEMCRVVRGGGFVYLNAPSNGRFHRHPTDNWRFYPDSGMALAQWGRRNGYDIRLIESFVGRRRRDIWNDCVMIFGKAETQQPMHPLADLFPRSFNIRLGEEQGFRNYCDRTEDMCLQDWLAQKLKIIPDAGPTPGAASMGGLIATLAEREVALAAVERGAVERAAAAEACLAEEARLRTEAEQRAAQAENRLAEETRLRTETVQRAAQAENGLAEEARRRTEAQLRGARAERRLIEETQQRINTEQRAARAETRIAEAEERLTALGVRAAQAEAECDSLRQERDSVLGSTFWLLMGPARRAATVLPAGLRRQGRRSARIVYWFLTPHRTHERIAYFRSRRGMALADPATDMELDPAEVVSEPRVAESPFAAPPIGEAAVEPFESWLDVNRWNARQEVHLRRRLAHAPTALPQISILMPVFNTPVVWLRRAIESVEMQLYGGWQLCISDNCSTDIETKQFLKSLIGDPRILVKFLPENVHIPRNTNSAAGLATGDFLVLLDSDDELTVDSLAEVALYIADNPETDLLYSDTDKIDEHGRRYDPAFKPDWSPEMLLSFMYAGQVLAVRRELFEALGGLRPGFEGSQDHDFALRAGERARHVGHIPKILYHWRSVPGSTARSGKEKPYAVVAGRKAVQEALERRGSRGVAVQPEWAKQGGNSLFVHEFPDEGPSVTVIMPTGGDVALLKTCVTGLLEETRYPIFELIILYNTSTRPEAFPYFEILSNDPRVQIIDSKGRFNFSRICNLGVAAARGEYLLLLNDDIVVTEPHWLGNMMGYAQLEGVGAVGAQLRFPDGRIQHAGVVHGFAGLSGHAFKLLPPGQNGYMSMVEVPRNYGAVTAACMLTRRSLYLEIGGLDEDHLGVAYNDPDYCYRLLQRGYRIVYTPSAVLTHLEGATRGKVDDPREVAAFRERYCNWIDPYYNPNLSLDDEQFHIQPRCVVLGERRDMRAAVFTHNLNWEGAPTLQCQTVSELRRRGILRPVVLSPMDGPLRSEYEAAGCQVIVAPLPVVPWEPQARYQDGVATLVGRLRALDVELVYANTVETHYAVDAARELGLPAIWNIHESEDWRHRFENWSPEVRSRLYRNFAYPYRVVFGAHATRRCYADLETRHNFAVIHNGLALGPIAAGIRLYTRESARRQNAISDTDVVFLVLGTVCERKGQRELIEAATRLGREDWQRMRIFIVGDRPGPYSEDLHAFVSALPELARQRVHIVAETGDTALFYRSADVFVCTSRIESYPRVIMEAMAYALPIITTPVFGIAEQVVEGVNSLLYDPGDPAALSALMNSLLEDTVLRERMSAASSDVLHTLTSFEQTCQQYTTIFAEAALSSVPDLA